MSKLSGRECSRIAVPKKVSARKIVATIKAIATRVLTATMKMAAVGRTTVAAIVDTEWLDAGIIS
ncbi:hypothetical protein X765_31795 [Mesorhizobium sp. LSHC440B00]|nr:hypothetical protein X765_31795 [Mesorhizobium sp. LSHC440B00]ESX30132.1 hypothetical protein X763_29880 [Mesorhizobium sp. LSHC432A00]ESX64966.1 hypothetical protein X757_32710 [Mesorhizobium sp. LSHC414A00]ESX97300.1 hypothetical protein X754_03090 [Mesorhizobium sp. LNJC403B00]